MSHAGDAARPLRFSLEVARADADLMCECSAPEAAPRPANTKASPPMTLPASLRLLAAAVLIAAGQPALAQKAAPAAPPSAAAASAPSTTARTHPPDATTRHAIEIGGRRLDYTAVAGTLSVRAAKGEHTADIFYVGYRAGDGAERPVTFVFNGGPGAASAFLHLGAMGPRVVAFSLDGASPVQPVALADNPDTWLAFTDLVFVDPVATGYSRAAGPGEDAERAFFGVETDADAMAEFVRKYLAASGRPLAPVFLVGESYGGFRAVLLAERLLGGGAQVRGAVLISPALEFSLVRGNRYALLPEALALPSIAAAHFEMQGGGPAPERLRPVEEFARSDYLVHLASGQRRNPAVNAALARFTGLDPELIARHHDRVSRALFVREYERRRDRALSRYDATVGAPAPRPARHVRFDPVLDGAVRVLAPAFEQYAREELGYRPDLRYRLLYGAASGNWDWGTSPTRQGYAGALDELQQARTRNPALRLLIANGYTDLVTPYLVSRYLVEQLHPIEGAAPVELAVYPGGHMMYLRPAARAALTRDAAALYRRALAQS